jgi:hypothetical protein
MFHLNIENVLKITQNVLSTETECMRRIKCGAEWPFEQA